jgi:hypothetical protein
VPRGAARFVLWAGAKNKVKGVREPSEEENSRGLEVRRFAPVFMSWLKAMTRKATARQRQRQRLADRCWSHRSAATWDQEKGRKVEETVAQEMCA